MGRGRRIGRQFRLVWRGRTSWGRMIERGLSKHLGQEQGDEGLAQAIVPPFASQAYSGHRLGLDGISRRVQAGGRGYLNARLG